MSIVTAQLLARYYEQYRTTEVTFNRQVASATGLVARNVYLKLQDRQVPCVVFSSSMQGARVIASIPEPVAAEMKASNRMTLRWCFKLPDNVEPITFFVPCHASGFNHYAAKDADLQIVSLDFTQRPADDLILILGMLLEANANAQRRKDERIVLTQETLKKMGLESREGALIVESAVYRCALRDISFSGAKVLTAGTVATFADRHISLKVSRESPGTDIVLAGIVRRVEEVEGHKDVITLGIEFEADTPVTWKLLISTYLSSVRKVSPGVDEAPHG